MGTLLDLFREDFVYAYSRVLWEDYDEYMAYVRARAAQAPREEIAAFLGLLPIPYVEPEAMGSLHEAWSVFAAQVACAWPDLVIEKMREQIGDPAYRPSWLGMAQHLEGPAEPVIAAILPLLRDLASRQEELREYEIALLEEALSVLP